MNAASKTLAFLALAGLALTGCNYSNPHGSQDLPPVTRLDSDPIGARVRIVRLNLELETPCDISEHVTVDDEIVMTAAGYRMWQGRIRDLPQTALGTYKCTLVR
jgi:hypothetical protein